MSCAGRRMKGVELDGRVRHAVQIEGLSQREAARRFGIDSRTVAKMMMFSVPHGYRRSQAPKRPKLDPFTAIIDQILEAERTAHSKQLHTSKRIFERLRDEYGYGGGMTIVKDYVHDRRQRQREVFVPLRHEPAMRRRTSARRGRSSAGWRRRSISSLWTCRTAMPASCRPIRRRRRRRFARATLRRSSSSARCRSRFCTTTPRALSNLARRRQKNRRIIPQPGRHAKRGQGQFASYQSETAPLL